MLQRKAYALSKSQHTGLPKSSRLGCHQACIMQDGQKITPSEGIAARQMLPSLTEQLRQELLADGIDPDAAAQVRTHSSDVILLQRCTM